MLRYRYALSFFVGVVIGFMFPFTASVWSFIVLLVVLWANERFGYLGFGDRWFQYRIDSYLLYTGCVVFVWFGIQLSSGSAGRFLVHIGNLIS